MDLELVFLRLEVTNSLLPVCRENIFILAGQALVNLSTRKDDVSSSAQSNLDSKGAKC